MRPALQQSEHSPFQPQALPPRPPPRPRASRRGGGGGGRRAGRGARGREERALLQPRATHRRSAAAPVPHPGVPRLRGHRGMLPPSGPAPRREGHPLGATPVEPRRRWRVYSSIPTPHHASPGRREGALGSLGTRGPGRGVEFLALAVLWRSRGVSRPCAFPTRHHERLVNMS